MIIQVKAKIEHGIVHFEVYRDGLFYCSEDTSEEAYRVKRLLEIGEKR